MADKLAAVQKELKETRTQLARALEERDNLQRDVESLCLAGADSMFSGSYVLSEKVGALHKELKEVRAALSTAKQERDDAAQDLAAAKAAQHALDAALSSTRQELSTAQGEREFYQAAAARSVGDVEALRQEVAALKAKLAEGDVLLGRAEAQATGEARARKEAEASLAQRHQQLVQLRSELEAKKTELSSVSRQLASQRDASRKLETSVMSLTSKLEVAGEDLERTKAQLHQFRESESRLRVQWQEAQALAAQLQGTSKGQAEQLASLDAQLAELRATTSERITQLSSSEVQLQQQLAVAQEQVTELSQEVRGVRHELQAAEQRLAQLRQVQHAQRTGTAGPGPGPTQLLHPAGPVDTPAATQQHAGSHAVEGSPHQPAAALEDASTSAAAAGGGVQAAPSAAPELLPSMSSASAAVMDAADDAEQLGILRTMVHDLKVKLAQATQEKVEALLRVAEVKQELAAAKSQLAARPPPLPHHHHHTQSHPAGATGNSAAAANVLALSSSPSTAGGGLAAALMAGLRGGRASGWLGGAATAPAGAGAAAAATGGEHAAGVSTPAGASSDGLSAASTPKAGSSSKPGVGLHRAAQESALPTLASAQPSPRGNAGAGATTQQQVGSASGTGTPRMLKQQSMPGSRTASETIKAAESAQQALVAQALVACVQQLVGEAAEYLASLKAAARVILAQHTDPALKWSALTGLSQLHVQLNRTRGRLGLSRPAGVLDDHPVPKEPVSAGMAKTAAAGDTQQPELCVKITAQVLELVDVGLACLEAYNRQEALTSVMAQ